jgi:hypothetical protein
MPDPKAVGAWRWRAVADLLVERGHNVFTPTLTGLGEREHLNSREVNLSLHARDIANLIRFERLENILLVAADELQKALDDADLSAAALRGGKAHDRAELLSRIVERVDLHGDRVEVTLDVGLLKLLGMNDRPAMQATSIAIEAVRVRRGHQLRLIVPGPGSARPKPARRNDRLVALVAEGRRARALELANPDQSIASIAQSEGRCSARLTKLVALSCLARDIVTAIVEGRQPERLTANRLMDMALPLSWTEQRAALGFSRPL